MTDETPKYIDLDGLAQPCGPEFTDEWIAAHLESLIARNSRDDENIILALQELQRRRRFDALTINVLDLGSAMIAAMRRAAPQDLNSPEVMGEHLARALHYHGFIVRVALPPPLVIPECQKSSNA